MKKKAFLLLIPILCFCMMFVTACGGGAETNTEPSSQPVESTAEVKNNINVLTGENTLSDEAVGKRPVAIMINNISDSLPQYGISDADIMYETLVEGGITRMMALYGDYTKVPSVCSVRSCRYYYPMVAGGFDAVYLHCGIDKKVAANRLETMGVDHIDGNDGGADEIFQRDQDRLNSMAYEHTMAVIGANIPSYFSSVNMRTDLSSDKQQPAFSFNKEGESVVPNGGVCKEVNLQFSDDYYSTFKYDASTKTYYKEHNGSDHMDVNTGKQLGYTNIIVLETDIHLMEGSDKLMDIDTTGSTVGTGYYVSDGGYEKIHWSKPSVSDYIKLTDENGREISINAGSSYIAMIKPDCTTVYEEIQ